QANASRGTGDEEGLAGERTHGTCPWEAAVGRGGLMIGEAARAGPPGGAQPGGTVAQGFGPRPSLSSHRSTRRVTKRYTGLPVANQASRSHEVRRSRRRSTGVIASGQ